MQKRAWLGLAIAVVTATVVTWMVATNGATEYWENDPFRLRVMFVFIFEANLEEDFEFNGATD